MDSPFTPPAPPPPPAPQPTANLKTPELPHAPEKLLTSHASAEAPHARQWGALIGIIIILLVLIVGALYFWGAKLAEEEQNGFIPEETQMTESAQQ